MRRGEAMGVTLARILGVEGDAARGEESMAEVGDEGRGWVEVKRGVA